METTQQPGLSLVAERVADGRARILAEIRKVIVGQDAVINPNVKIYPFKTVEAGAIVTSSIVWESRGARTLFGPRGVRGLANVDISPDVVARVAMAYGTALPKGSTISTSRDTSRLARALKRGLISGLNLSGINVEDIELALEADPLDVLVEPTHDGCAVTATARSFARDVTLLADRAAPHATVDDALVTLAAGQSATFRVRTKASELQETLDRPPVLRTANDLQHTKTDVRRS